MTHNQELFSYYCLDKLMPLDEPFLIRYFDEEGSIFTEKYYLALRADIRREDCFVLYTETDKDFEQLVFIPTSIFYDNYERLSLRMISENEYNELVKKMFTINVFEFTSLYEFSRIYESFKRHLDKNWEQYQLDELFVE